MTGNIKSISQDLNRAAAVAVNSCLKVKSGERILIITNPEADVQIISQALYDACIKAGASPVLAVQPAKTQFDCCEDTVIAAIKANPEIIVSLSHQKLGKDREAQKKPYIVEGKKIDSTFHYLLETKKCRGFWSPSISLAQFIRTVPVDYSRMKSEAAYLKERLDAAVAARIRCPAGTDLYIGLAGRTAFVDDGDYSKAGDGGNLPAGETYISPRLGTARGRIAFSGSIAVYDGVIVPDGPVCAEVRDGFVQDVSGGKDAGVLRESLERGRALAFEYAQQGILDPAAAEEYGRNAFSLGELGIGINPQAEITGNMLVDEKAYTTCHIAIGSNYDNDANALIHLDGLIRTPTVTLEYSDGSSCGLMRNGVLELHI
ncbi:MAG: aminopeptidase [Spirochaetales bacterium]|nr:aminopeptidase [Spirochaetales bacterium]